MNEGGRLRKVGEWAHGALDEMNHMTVPEAENLATCVLADIRELAKYEDSDLAQHLQPSVRTWQRHAELMKWTVTGP